MKCQHASFLIKNRSVSLEEIQLCHPDVESIARMSCSLWKIDPKQFQCLGRDRLLDILLHNPITCLHCRNRLWVIGGFRSWSIAMKYRHSCEVPFEIPIQVIDRKMNTMTRRDFAITSLLMTAIAQSLGQKATLNIGAQWVDIEKIAPDIYNNFFRKNAPTKSRLPSEFGLSFACFFEDRNSG